MSWTAPPPTPTLLNFWPSEKARERLSEDQKNSPVRVPDRCRHSREFSARTKIPSACSTTPLTAIYWPSGDRW